MKMADETSKDTEADTTDVASNTTDIPRSSSAASLLGEQLVSSSEFIRHESSPGVPASLSDITEKSESMQRSSSDEDTDGQAGRPPLAPPPVAMAQQDAAAPILLQQRPPPVSQAGRIQSVPILPRAPPDHARKQSAGEYSFMSGLTDSSSGDGEVAAVRAPKQPSRNRTVSFDQSFFDNAAIRTPGGGNNNNILQPILNEGPMNGESLHPPATHRRTRTRTVDLAELTADNPLETEAETAIIAAIEEENRIEENRRRADSASVLLPHVPDEGVNMFEDEASTRSKRPASSLKSSTHSQEASKPPTSPGAGSKGRSHRRTKSTMPPEGIKMEPPAAETLEDTLTGLADAMRKIHTETSEQVDESEVKRHHRRVPTRDIGHPTALLEDTPINNADILVHNANKLLRRNVKPIESTDDEESSSSSEHDEQPPATAGMKKEKSIWNVFEAKADHKKTDGDIIEHNDEASKHSNGAESPEIASIDESFHSSTDEIDEHAAGDIEECGIPASEAPDRSKRPMGGLTQLNRKIMKSKRLKKTRRKLRHSRKRCRLDFEMFVEFLRPKKGSIVNFCRACLLILVPLCGVAAILFYLVGNPLIARNGASISWLLLFLARQVVTFTMAQASSLFLIDFLSLRTRWTVRVLGSTLALFIVQSKGFPFIMTMWTTYDFMLLSGAHALANNWLFWQEAIDMCNASNPSGDIPSSSVNYRILGSILGAGIAISIKRFWVGLYLGRRTYAHYGDQLAKVIENMILISEVASLGRDFEIGTRYSQPKLEKSLSEWDFRDVASAEERSIGDEKPALNRPTLLGKADRMKSEKIIDEDKRNKYTGTLSPSQRIKISQLLDHWVEPEIAHTRETGASINAILQFRQALTFMDNSFPFSLAFGPAENREVCIESAQRVYERLMIRNQGHEKLSFDTIAVVAIDKNGVIDQKKMKNLIRIFRPDKEGELSLLDFVRCCDMVYKSLRLLRASISNSGQIDRGFESIMNWAFYTVLVCIILAANGFNPLALFLSFSSVLLAFAFVIGSASSKYFEGILFILVRRPYDIGDRIAIADVNSETSINGTLTWFVQKVNLYTTTVRYSGTNEVATLANGSLATSRIINAARSPKAVVHVYLKFSVDVPYARVQCFKKTVENFIKARPREWIALARFRATRVEADLGYIEYALDLQHRESWQQLAVILMSKADLQSFCLEVSKQLDMRYKAPSLPVDLSLKDTKAALERIKELHEEPIQQVSHDFSEHTGNDDSKSSPALRSSAASHGTPDVRAISALFERPQE